jgi:hypothetical protein
MDPRNELTADIRAMTGEVLLSATAREALREF